MRTSVVLAVGCCVAPAPASADTNSFYYSSLEWLVDTSDSIVEATVVCDWVVRDGRGRCESTVKSVDRVLKKVGKGAPPAGADLKESVAAKGEHRMLLLTAPTVNPPGKRDTYCIFLAPHPAPKDPAKPPDPFAVLPLYSSAWEPLSFHRPVCVAIDKGGKVLTDPAVVKAVEARVKADPERVRATGHDHNLLVPYEPEHKKGFLAGVASKDGWERARAAGHLGHYPGDDVVAALKAALADGFVGEITENGKRVKAYPVRRAAYASLRALGVDVPQPELAPAP